jgi:thiol-disulfide isomerase/thioredoxin
MSTEPSTPQKPSPLRLFGGVLAIVICGAVLLTMAIRTKPMTVERAPEIHVAGWLNGPGPKREDLQGKVIVLDAWAFWCGPCVLKAPELIELYERYRDRGVIFIGLTAETADTLDKSRAFLKQTKIPWPNGYGCGQTLLNLNNQYLPQTWVIDRKYNLVWDSDRASEPMEAAIDRALAESP